jgi:hypothetical protein
LEEEEGEEEYDGAVLLRAYQLHCNFRVPVGCECTSTSHRVNNHISIRIVDIPNAVLGGFQVLPKLVMPEEKWNKNLCGKFPGEDQQINSSVLMYRSFHNERHELPDP